jgi:hypothetical protein
MWRPSAPSASKPARMRGRFEVRSLRRGLGPVALCYGLAVVVPVVWGACIVNPVIVSPATTISPGTSSVSVDPDNFLGSIVCGSQPGMMQSYVATVTDVLHACNLDTDCRAGTCVGATPMAAGHCTDSFTLPSSPPTSCAEATFFEYIAIGDGFTAVVDGYEQPADQLIPVCSRPGKATSCTTDSTCAAAFGCSGRCLVTTFQDENVPCLESCLLPTSTVDTLHQCLLASNLCARNNFVAGDAGTALQQYQACVEMCGVDPTCLVAPPNGGPVNCLNLDFAPLQTACESAAAAVDDAGVLPQNGLVPGALKACTCAYTPSEGSRQMLDLAGTPVTPLWSLTPSEACGRGPLCGSDADCPASALCQQDTPTSAGVCVPISITFVDVPLSPCGSLCADGGTCATSATTAILVVPSASLPPLACQVDGGTAGTVTSFAVVPAASTGLPTETFGCAVPASTTYASGIVVGQQYAFTIQAFEGGTAPTYSAACFATPVAGITVTAQCDPFTCIPDAGAGTGDASACP